MKVNKSHNNDKESLKAASQGVENEFVANSNAQLSPPKFDLKTDQSIDKKMDKNFGQFKGLAKSFMQQTGADISDVKVKVANSKLDELGAEGAAKGNKIYMKSSDSPDSEETKNTFMHEMVHVVQQNYGQSKKEDPENSEVNDDLVQEKEAENWQSFKGADGVKVPNQGPQGSFQLKRKKKKISNQQSYRDQIFSKLGASYQIFLNKRAVYRRVNYEAGKSSYTEDFTGMLNQFVTRTNDLIKTREYNEKYIDDSAKDKTAFLKKYTSAVGKFSNGAALLSNILSSSGDEIDDSIGRFEAFLSLLSDHIPEIPIISHYLKFLFDGGKKILSAIKKIKENIAELNATGRHAAGSDYKAMSNANGSQQLLDYLNNQAFRKKDAASAAPVPEIVKSYVYNNEDRLQLDINLDRNELPPDDSLLSWSTYEEKKLRAWIFNNREAIYEKFTGHRK